MKTLKTLLFSLSFFLLAGIASAQTKTQKLAVAGECGMCKKKIEKAAKTAGASYAVWSSDDKVLTVKYNSSSTNTAKIEKAVAAAGYDTKSVKATDAAYEKLDECCKYSRATDKDGAQACCEHEACKQAACTKDGSCGPDTACCKEAGCDKKACCKKS